MRTSLTTDPSRGAGYAIIRLDIADLGNVSLPSMPEGYAFSLQRASDALFLAQSGWQESQSSQTPDSVDKQGSVLELSVGPHVVDNLDVLDTYRIHLRHTSLPASVLSIESLDYSPLKGKEGLAMPGASPVSAPQPEPEPIPEPEPAPQPEPEPEPLPEPLTMASSPPETEKNPSRFAPLIRGFLRGLVIFVVLLGIAWGYYYWQQQKKAEAPADSAQTEQSSPQTPPSPAPAPAPANPAATPSPAPEGTPALAPLAQARKQLQQGTDPAQHLALARSLQEQKDIDPAVAAQSADAVFLLVEDAAQKGSAEAMLLLARYFDPVDTGPKGSIQADPSQACHWYLQARAQGQQQPADQGLTALRNWAEAAAAKGDAKAKEVLSQLPAK